MKGGIPAPDGEPGVYPPRNRFQTSLSRASLCPKRGRPPSVDLFFRDWAWRWPPPWQT